MYNAQCWAFSYDVFNRVLQGGKVMCVVHWFCQTELAQHWSTNPQATSDVDILHAVAAALAGEEAGFLLALSCVGSLATWI